MLRPTKQWRNPHVDPLNGKVFLQMFLSMFWQINMDCKCGSMGIRMLAYTYTGRYLCLQDKRTT